MKIQACICTDKGIKKEVNQDAVMMKVADTDSHGRISLTVLCDGMGGLSFGEVASAAFVNQMQQWFTDTLPEILTGAQTTEKLDRNMPNGREHFAVIENQWSAIVQEMNVKIAQYGNERAIRLGTTAIALLIIGQEYLIMNIGDSRVYAITAQDTKQLTHDQSYVQQQVDLGYLTEQEAENSSQKSVLLQCIGASDRVVPDYHHGTIQEDTVFMLCSDGFWRKQSIQEIFQKANPAMCMDEELMKRNMLEQIMLLEERGETDNISVALAACTC